MKKLKILGIFGLGFVLGACLAGGLIAVQYSKMFRDQYYADILEVVNTAYMIRDGREEQLLKNSEANIRQCVLSADSLWPDTEARLGAFWYLQRYYQRFDIDVPDDIKPILDRLPPQPPRERAPALQEDSNSI